MRFGVLLVMFVFSRRVVVRCGCVGRVSEAFPSDGLQSNSQTSTTIAAQSRGNSARDKRRPPRPGASPQPCRGDQRAITMCLTSVKLAAVNNRRRTTRDANHVSNFGTLVFMATVARFRLLASRSSYPQTYPLGWARFGVFPFQPYIHVLPNNAPALRASVQPERRFCCLATRGRPTRKAGKHQRGKGLWCGVLIVRFPIGSGCPSRSAHNQPAEPVTNWLPASGAYRSGPHPTDNGRPVARCDTGSLRCQTDLARHSKGQGCGDSMTRCMVDEHDRRGLRRPRESPAAGRVVSVWIV